jgi:hypothetical protein
LDPAGWRHVSDFSVRGSWVCHCVNSWWDLCCPPHGLDRGPRGRFEVGLYIDPLISGIRYTYVVLALCWVANAAAMALFIWEWTQGVSNFYTQSYGYLIATVVVTGLFVLLELLLIFAIYVFHRDLDHAWAEGWTPQYTKKDPQYSEPKDKMDDEERLLQGGSGSGGDGGDFDIKSQLRRTRVQVRTRLVK